MKDAAIDIIFMDVFGCLHGFFTNNPRPTECPYGLTWWLVFDPDFFHS
jgi:hypothetical protein